jgi:hypothetical protein
MYVVVSAQIEPADLLLLRPARRQDQYRRLVLTGAHRAQHIKPVHFRQGQVEDDEIEIFGCDHRVGRCAVADNVDGIATAAQNGDKPFRERLIVLDQ